MSNDAFTMDRQAGIIDRDDVARHPYRAAAQLRKAIKLRDALTLAGAESADDVRTLNGPARRLAESAAGVPLSSETTWALVAVLFE